LADTCCRFPFAPPVRLVNRDDDFAALHPCG
jgi:hypothetical protein